VSAIVADTGPGGPPPSGPLDPAAPVPTPRRPWPWLIIGAVLVAAAVIVIVAAVVARGRRHPSRVPAAPVATGPAQQRKLISALHTADRMTLHATYRALGDPAKLGGSLTYEVWQRPPAGREDRNGAPSERCRQQGQGFWSCNAAPGAPPAVAGAVPGPLDLLAAIGRQGSSPSARQAVTTSADVVGNEKVMCYQLAAGGQTYVLCASADGTPELIASTTVRYELVSGSPTVASSDLNG
jgi:hypothetical protein